MKRVLLLLICVAMALPTAVAFGAPQKSGGKSGEANVLARRGTEAARNRQWDDAIDDLRKATEMDRKYAPSLVAALLGRAATNASQQQFQQAAADYDEVLKLDSKNTTAIEGRGSMALKLNDQDKALAMYKEASKIDGKEIRYLQYIAYIYEVKGDLKDSMAENDKVLKLQPSNPDAIARKQRLETRLAQDGSGAAPAPAQSAPQGKP